MSKLGYISKSFGKETNVAIANTYSANVFNSSNLPENSIIITSPVDDNNDDIGSYSILMTDYLSNPIRLTYTIKTGNGLEYHNDTDSIKIDIDNKNIVESDKKLTANIKNLIDNKTIIYDEDIKKIAISYQSLDNISYGTKGLFRIDENNIKINYDERIFVDTSTLKYANQYTEVSGIGIGDNHLVVSDQGVLTVKQDNIKHASADDAGLVRSDNYTIPIKEGIMEVNTRNLETCTNENAGIAKADNDTIFINGNNELEVNTQRLSSVSSSSKGVFKYDSSCFDIVNDSLETKNTQTLLDTIEGFSEKDNSIKKYDEEIDYLLHEYQVSINKPSIFDFHASQLLTGVLEKPMKLNELPNEMPTQFMEVVLMINTNCPFRISIKFEDNIDPQISLYEINYNDIFVYHGNEGLENVYQMTENKTLPIKLTFICKNFYNADNKVYSNKIKINIVASYSNDGNIFKEIKYSIIRFNSAYRKYIIYDDENVENIIIENPK